MDTAAQNQSDTLSPVEALHALLDQDMKAVNAIILERMNSHVPLIPQLAAYLIAAGGKRLRPLLTLACVQAFGGDMAKGQKLAAAVEFIHTATLLHDDVVDDSAERRGQKSANLVFGNQESVLVGDFLFSKSFQLMVEAGSLEVLDSLSNASCVITEGEVLQLSLKNRFDVDPEDYLNVIKAKTAALFAAACEVGPNTAERGSHAQRRAAHDFGLNLGIAFQIVDDALDYSAERKALGKDIGDDFREGKMTAPLFMVLKECSADEKTFLQESIETPSDRPEDLQRAQDLIQAYNAIEKSLDWAREFAEEAKQKLSVFPEGDCKTLLSDLVDESVMRKF